MKNKMFWIIGAMIAILLVGVLDAEAAEPVYKNNAGQSSEVVLVNASYKRPRVTVIFNARYPKLYAQSYYQKKPYCRYGGYYRYRYGRYYYNCYRYPRRYRYYHRYHYDY